MDTRRKELRFPFVESGTIFISPSDTHALAKPILPLSEGVNPPTSFTSGAVICKEA